MDSTTMNSTLTLLIYGIVAVSLVSGGIYALNRGFKLILSGRGRSKEDSTVEVLGLKATVGSLGALVMITAFLWGLAAVKALPNYKDPKITIALKQKEEIISNMEKKLATTEKKLSESSKVYVSAKKLQESLVEQQKVLAKCYEAVKMTNTKNNSQLIKEIEASMAEMEKKHDRNTRQR